jgi:hypothetical protein
MKKFLPASTEGLTEPKSGEQGAKKMIIDGQLYIQVGECVYNAEGRAEAF